jgi:hypothetical protein
MLMTAVKPNYKRSDLISFLQSEKRKLWVLLVVELDQGGDGKKLIVGNIMITISERT